MKDISLPTFNGSSDFLIIYLIISEGRKQALFFNLARPKMSRLEVLYNKMMNNRNVLIRIYSLNQQIMFGDEQWIKPLELIEETLMT